MNNAAARRSFDVVVLGAGAAGLMCAIEAGKRGRSVAVLECESRPGKKILISGGGRCNFTNLHCSAENFLSANPHFAKSALARFTPADFIALVKKHGIAYHEKTLGQLFCDGSARQIVDLLMSECAEARVEVILGANVHDVRRSESGFLVETGNGVYESRALVVATGGLSIPKMGATGVGYDIARRFGVQIRECRPALVPLVLGGAEKTNFCDLTGVSADVMASFGKQRFRERLLITHRGLSGPAILQISSYREDGKPITVDWAPEQELLAGLRESNARRDAVTARAELRKKFPARLADRLLEIASPAGWGNAALTELDRRLHAWSFSPAGTEGYEKAEVTAGGVDTDALSPQTMECRGVPGLYFIGEVVDVTGQLGGFNFQWAWASGAVAGRAV